MYSSSSSAPAAARAQGALPEALADLSPAQRAKVDVALVGRAQLRRGAVIVQLGSAELARCRSTDRARVRAEVARLQGRVMPDVPAADFAVAYQYESHPRRWPAPCAASARSRGSPPAPRSCACTRRSTSQFDLVASVAQIRANARHAQGNLGAGVVVAVLDSGVDTDHPDLADSLVGQECFLSGGGCPGGGTRRSGPGAAEDDVGHGTHVAGIITSNGGVSDGPGVAPSAGILAMKIGNASGVATADWLAALDFILAHPQLGVRVVNMSFGTSLLLLGERLRRRPSPSRRARSTRCARTA